MSDMLKLNWPDILKSVLMAFLGAFVAAIYGIIQSGRLPTLPELGTAALAGLTALVAYLIKNFFTNSQGQFANVKALGPVAKAVVIILLLGVCSQAQAQGFDNFWHPRPAAAKAAFQPEFVAGAPASIWEFKPTLALVATSFRPVSGGPMQTGLLAGAGPALTFQNSTQDANGVNYANYSASLAFLMTGNTQTDPTFEPALALLVGTFNNLIAVGVEYDLVQRTSGVSRFALLLNLGINLTNN